jgi:hypothetical protein
MRAGPLFLCPYTSIAITSRECHTTPLSLSFESILAPDRESSLGKGVLVLNVRSKVGHWVSYAGYPPTGVAAANRD